MKTKIRKIPRVIISVVLALALLVSSSTAAMIISGASIGRQRTTGASTVVEEGVVEETDNETVGAADDEMVGAAADDDDMVSAAADDDSVGAVAEDNDESVGAALENDDEAVGTTYGGAGQWGLWIGTNDRDSMNTYLGLTTSGNTATATKTLAKNDYFMSLVCGPTENWHYNFMWTSDAKFTNNYPSVIMNPSWQTQTWYDSNNNAYNVHRLKFWCNVKDTEVRFIVDTTTYSITVAATVTIPNVASSVNLTTSTSTVTDASPTATLTATPQSLHTDLTGKTLTYTFYAGDTSLGSVTSNTGSATYTVTQTDQKTVNYKVKVSYTGYNTVTSSEVTITNSSLANPEYKLIGYFNSIDGEQWKDDDTKPISSVDPAYGANVFYVDVTARYTYASHNNYFKLRKVSSGEEYGPSPSSANKELTVNGGSVDTLKASSLNSFYFKPNKSGTHRIYVDQNSTPPKIWVEDDRDVFITNSTAFSGYIENDVVKKSNVGYFTSDANTQFRAFSSGSIYSETAITSDTPFMISNKKGVAYDVEYSIRQDLCTGVSLSQQHVMVGDAEDGDYAQVFHIQSNKVDSEYTKNITIHIDNDAKEIWATSTFDMSKITSKTVESSKTVRYYFAVTDVDYSKFASNGKLYIHYWNNSLAHENWYGNGNYYGHADAVPVKKNGTTSGAVDKTDNIIHVDLHNPVTYVIYSGVDGQENQNGDRNFKMLTDKTWGTGAPGYNATAYIYCADIPVWATSFSFARFSDYKSFCKITNNFSQRGIVLNPNRVYLAFNGDSGVNYYTTAIRLDESLWDNNTKIDADEDKKFIKYFKTNLIKYKADADNDHNPTMNEPLLNEYRKRGIENELYFGGFWSGSDFDENGSEIKFGDTKTYNYKGYNNLAQRKTGDSVKFAGKSTYYASTWDLAGNVLDKSKTNNLGGWLLTDTYQKDVLPFFDYDTLYSSDNTTGNANIGTVYKNVDFPFYKTTYKGITSYSYDSMSDYNREFSEGKYTFTKYEGMNKMQGYKPFFDQKKSFANEFDVNFYMTPTGYLKDSSNNNQDIAFNFSGDDDVWVYIDGVKVLDLGGAHMISAASINLSDMKVYYKTPTKSTMDLTGLQDEYAYSSNNMYAVDLKKLFAAYGVDFKNTDASTHHTLQMFYMERGQNESNCSISFNLPQNSGLRIQNEIDTSGVNKGLVDATLRAANLDYFSYYVENKLASGDQRSDANTFYNMNGNLPAVATGKQSQTFYTDTPKFPAYNTTTVNRVSQGITQLLLTGEITTGTDSDKPSLPDTHSAGTAFGLSGIHYSLADAYASGTIDDTLSGTVLDYYVDNVKQEGVALNLLYGESATFNSKITPHTWLEVKQHNQLYYPAADSTIIRGAKVDDNIAEEDKRNVSRFYSTSYTITDDSANKTMNKVTSVNNLEEDVVAHSGDNTTGYYFSNYSGTTDVDDNVAATYKFVNSPHTGTININKIIDATNPNPKASFKFTIQFKDIFGVSNDKVGLTADQYSDYPVKYKVVDADGNVSERDYGVTKGILLRNGETAQILGIPAGTHYQIIEQERSGYELEKIIKSAYRSGVMKNGYPKTYTNPADFTKDADIDYQSKDDTGDYLADFAFYNKPVLIKVTLKYYDRYVHSGGETEISSSPTSYSYTVSDWSDLPAKDKTGANITWYRDNDDGEYIYINTEQLITYTTGLADIGNVIAGYTFWTSNTEARTEIAKAEHVHYNNDTKIGHTYADDYPGSGVLNYHTDYIGTPVATADGYDTSKINADMWVCYKDKSGSVLNFDTPSTENYKDIATIEVWGYNYPKEYSITPHTVAADKDSNELTTEVAKYNSDGEVINGSDEPAYIVGTASGTSLSGNLYNTRVGGAYWPHYNADLSNKDLEDAKVILLNRPSEYFQKYGLKKGYTGEYPATAESFISENKTYKFAYWASDAAGKNKITSDYNYGYRIVKTMDIYPVYFPSDIVKTPSLSLTSLAPDTYTSGSTVYRRINNIVAVSDLEPYDSNLTDVTALYVRLGADSSNTQDKKTELDLTKLDLNAIKHNFQQALAEAATWGSAPKTVYIDVTAKGTDDTRRGTVYRYNVTFTDNPTSDQIQVNNKNRMLITHSFKNTLFDDGATFHEMLVFAAVKYGNDWITSDNYAVYVGGVPK